MPWSAELLGLFAATYGGSIALFAVSKRNKLEPFSLASAVGLRSAHPIAVTLDMLLSCLLGSYLVFLLASPITGAQAVAAGLGMTGILSAFARTDVAA